MVPPNRSSSVRPRDQCLAIACLNIKSIEECPLLTMVQYCSWWSGVSGSHTRLIY